MHNKFMDQITKHPVLYIFVAIISTAMATWMTSSFATMAYVDKEVGKVTQYVDKRHSDVKMEMREIKSSVKTTEGRVYQIWLHVKQTK